MQSAMTAEKALKVLSYQLKAYRVSYLEMSETEFARLINIPAEDVSAMERGANITVDRWLRVWNKMGTLKAGLNASIPRKQLAASGLENASPKPKP